MNEHLVPDEEEEEDPDPKRELMRLRKEIGMIQWNGDHDTRLKNLEKMMKKIFKQTSRNPNRSPTRLGMEHEDTVGS